MVRKKLSKPTREVSARARTEVSRRPLRADDISGAVRPSIPNNQSKGAGLPLARYIDWGEDTETKEKIAKKEKSPPVIWPCDVRPQKPSLFRPISANQTLP
jgi:hypothetical protein